MLNRVSTDKWNCWAMLNGRHDAEEGVAEGHRGSRGGRGPHKGFKARRGSGVRYTKAGGSGSLRESCGPNPGFETPQAGASHQVQGHSYAI